MAISREERIKMLHEKDTYGYWKFINIDTEYLSVNDCTVKCLKCENVFYHKKALGIFAGTSTMCKDCAAKERGHKAVNKMKERYKENPYFGCMKVINIDTEFVSSTDCTVQCTKCGNIIHHYTMLVTKEKPTRCLNCRTLQRFVGQKFLSADNVTLECIGCEEGHKVILKDTSNNFIRTYKYKGAETDFSKIKFYSNLSVKDYKNFYLNKAITSKDGIKVIVKSIREDEKKRLLAELENIETGEKQIRDLRTIRSIGFKYYYDKPNFAEVGSICITKDGFSVKVLENSKSHSRIKFNDGVIAEFKTIFHDYYEGMKRSYSHPNISSSKFGKYFDYVLEGVLFRLNNPEDVYYKCKKDGSDEYEILRPCDIDALQKG